MSQASTSLFGTPDLDNSLVGALSHPAEGSVRSTPSLKRRASFSHEDAIESSRKKTKQDEDERDETPESTHGHHAVHTTRLVTELEEEMLCGCCSELVYRPVVVLPCQHFFCGSCCVLWIKNGGTNCPACRTISSIVIPCLPLQKIVDAYLRSAPSRVRAERERAQADEVYKAGTSMRIPSPREASPEPNFNLSREYTRPCPHCALGNPYGWTCPQPIPDPNTDLTNAWHADSGTPPGHGYCGNCENILALASPSTTRCDFCLVAFCGIAVQGRCCAVSLRQQEPHGFLDVGDLIQSPEVYSIFDDNTVEVDYLFDHLTSQRVTPKQLFDQIVEYYMSQPNTFQPMFDNDIFMEMYPVESIPDPDPRAPRQKCCRMCAAEILLFGLRDWWVRQRRQGLVDEAVLMRPDCPEGRSCTRQRDHGHAREFNHIISIPTTLPTLAPSLALPPTSHLEFESGIHTPPVFLPPPPLDTHPTEADKPAPSIPFDEENVLGTLPSFL